MKSWRWGSKEQESAFRGLKGCLWLQDRVYCHAIVMMQESPGRVQDAISKMDDVCFSAADGTCEGSQGPMGFVSTANRGPPGPCSI